jgi:RimJ/RimL family protein N-acetyltransferase
LLHHKGEDCHIMGKFLSGAKIYLRALTKDDCGVQYLAFVNDFEALSFVEGIGYKTLNKQDLVEYVESCNNAENLLVGIFENETDAHVGNIHLSRIKPYHNNCILGIVLGRNYMGRGYGYEASSLLMRQ